MVKESAKKNSRSIILLILDGWGVGPDYEGNAIAMADTPVFDRLIAEYPSTTLCASSPSFDNKEIKINNSEMGHVLIGAGRPIEVNLDDSDKALHNTLSDILAQTGKVQIKIGDESRFAHVTYYFNGFKATPLKNEKRVLVSDNSIIKYEDRPELAVDDLVKAVIEQINEQEFDFLVVNFPNVDIFGHTGNIKATKSAIKIIDRAIDRLEKKALEKQSVFCLVGSHGNAESMISLSIERADSEHTNNPVPFILVGHDYIGRNVGWEDVSGGDLSAIKPRGSLIDVAPTLLSIMKIEAPKVMTGKNLLLI